MEVRELTYPLLKYFCSDAQGADGATVEGIVRLHRMGSIPLGPRGFAQAVCL